MVKKHWILGHLNDVIDSLVAGVSVNSGEDDASGNFFILKTSAISKGKLNLSEKKPVLPREVARLKCSLRQETILISRMNTPELVGECAYVPCDDPRIYLPDRIWQTNFKKDVDVSAKWLNYLLSSKKYRSLIQNCATGTSNSMKNISKEQLLGLEILYPSFREQTSIAEALSDVDSLISSLQELIEKKKAIKQGTMQELLTGKKRLPGFSGEWSNLRIEEIANLHDNLRVPVEKSMRKKGNIPYYGANGIQDYVNGYTHNGSYVLIAEDGANDLQEYPIRYASGKIWVNNHVHVLNGKNSVSDTRFLSYSMSTIDYQAAITGGTRAKLNGHILMQLSLDLPPLAEQQAIAQVLSDMDSEIEQLKKKLSKYQQIKQGMMQELLTGRIRLV